MAYPSPLARKGRKEKRMTREEAIDFLSQVKDAIEIRKENGMKFHVLSFADDQTEVIDMAISALKTEPSDLISRADAIEALISEANHEGSFGYVDAKGIADSLQALPSAEAVHKPDYSYEADMVRRLKESQKGSYTGFCKSQLITCKFVKACNGVCPFEDALKHADKTQTMNDQHTVDHDRAWIIGCIEHDGFIKTDRFDKANQIILDALSGEAETKCVAQIKVDTEEVVRRIKEEYDITDGWILCSERLPKKNEVVLITNGKGNVRCGQYRSEYDVRDGTHYWWWKGKTVESVLAWMTLPKPYREEGE